MPSTKKNSPLTQSADICLGIDPGIARVGYGLVKINQANQLTTLDYGCVTTSAKLPMADRLLDIYQTIKQIIIKYRPNCLAVEHIYFARNAKTALIVGHARGIILLLAAQHKLNLVEFTPLQIKQALTGYGQADKRQVGSMVKLVLRLKEVPQPDDVSDALAIAICGVQTKIIASI